MFIKDGKSIFGNGGLLISICILLMLLYFSYNKCYINTNNYYNTPKNTKNKAINDKFNSTPKPNTKPYNDIINSKQMYNFTNNIKVESFRNMTDTDKANSLLPKPENVRVIVNAGTITVKFTLDKFKGVQTPSHFMIVLAQYDKNKKPTGNNKFIMSNEYEITSSVEVTESTYQTNVCSIIDDLPKCNYVFKNIDIIDATGSLYYYKVGVSAVYDDNNNKYNTDLITPYNINIQDKLFTINNSIDNQNTKYTDYLKSQSYLNSQSSSYNVYDSTISTADGKYELIKSQLGNYPDNLVIDENTIGETSLSDLVDKTMAQGIININVK